jgi:GNAT superfamily N-acetyltransferase
VITLDAARRDEAIEAGWLAYRGLMDEDEHRRQCAEWNVIAVVEPSGSVICALFAKDGELHLGIVPEWRNRWASRRLIKRMLEHGYRTRFATTEQKRFIDRCGQIGDRR